MKTLSLGNLFMAIITVVDDTFHHYGDVVAVLIQRAKKRASIA
jgi:hypothetical protein